MTEVAEALTKALALHRLGHWDEAEGLYRHVLAQDATNIDAWHLLGMLAHQRGLLDIAETHIRRALELKPDFADAHNNLGNVLKDQGRLEEAAACYQWAAELNPGLPEAQLNLGNYHQQAGKASEAIGHYRRALAIRPDYVEAHSNLGAVVQAIGQLDEAIACYRQAIHLDPSNADTRYNLATALQAQGKFAEAIAEYRQTLAQKPDFAAAWFNLGNTYRETGAFNDAIPCYSQAIKLKPNDHKAYTNQGVICYSQERPMEAIHWCDQALQLDPHSPEAHLIRSFGLLLIGDFKHGFEENEWRLKISPSSTQDFQQPQWHGESLGGHTILLHTEQGYGDTLQFIRYASLVKQRGGHVVVQCQPRLNPLLATCPGVDEAIEEGQTLPDFDVQSPLLSLPHIFDTTLESVPTDIPYVFADATVIQHWREQLSGYPGVRIGINWRGGGYGLFPTRDIPLELFARLGKIDGVTLFSLQRGPPRDELLNLHGTAPIIDPGDDVDVASGAFMDTAAIMMNLDLVITSDTATAHLAGALGVPVWVALPFAPEWRWLLNRADSPWYPTMRLFRQPQHGDWTTVFDEIEAELRTIAHKP